MDLETTVRDLAPRLLRYGLAATGDPGLAEEAAQDALTALVRRWRHRGPPASAEAFVFAIARRRAARAAVRRRLFGAPAGEDNGHRPGPPSPEAVASRRERLARVAAAVRALPSGERRALLLVGVGGLTHAEAAALLGVSTAAVKMRVHRARRRLTERLEASDGRATG